MNLVTFADMYNELRSRMGAGANSTLYTTTRLKSAINEAYGWAIGAFPWPGLEKSDTTNSFANQDYYDYPAAFKSDSITRLEVDGKSYSRKQFYDFLQYREDNANDTTRLFTQFARQYFIFPAPKTAGVDNISIWGLQEPPVLAGDTDITIFSYNESLANSCIVVYANGILIEKANQGEPRGRVFPGAPQKTQALQELAVLFKRVQDRRQSDQSLNRPMFNIPDFFHRPGFGTGMSNTSNNTPIGGF